MSNEPGNEGQADPGFARRDILATVGAVAVGGVAGCSQSAGTPTGSGNTPTTTPPGATTTTARTTTPANPCESPTVLSPSDVEDGGTVSAGCYRAENTLTVERGTLTLEAGVVIQFTQNEGLEVESEGRLRASGTEGEPVILTGTEESRGFWKGIRIGNSNPTDNVLGHTVVQYAGASSWNPNYSPAGVFVRGETATLSVRQSTVRSNASMGLTATQPEAQLDLQGVSFEDNEAPLYIPANLAGGIAPNTAFENNDESAVFLGEPSGAGWTTVTESAVWPALDVPYRSRINVHVEAPVEVAPGTTVEFEQGRGMQVRGEGRLTADAAEAEPITFRGTEEITGFWKGLFFTNSLSSDNLLRNVLIENGGSGETESGGANDVANLYVDGDQTAAAVTVSNSTVRGSGKYGIAVRDGNARLMGCDGVTFANNAGADTYNLEAGAPISRCQ